MNGRTIDLALPSFGLEAGPWLDRPHLRAWIASPGDEGLAPYVVEDPGLPAPIARSAAARAAIPLAQPVLDADVPTRLVVHALTGDARVGGALGWWAPLVGPGQPLDPTRQRILCFNQLGSCYGSFGPADEGFPARPPSDDPAVARWPAPLTAFDQARAILLALDGLGIDRVDALIGGSLGGMVALSLAVLAPERFDRLVNIAGDPISTAWIRAYNHVGRTLIAADPHRGLDAARQLAMISYRAPEGFQRRFPGDEITAWLDHHGRSLVARFDPFAYVAQLDAMDHTDVERVPRRDPAESWRPAEPWGLKRYPNPLFGVGISTDQLYPPARVRQIVDDHLARGGHGAYAQLDDDNGHDAFLIAFDPLRDILRAFLDR